LKHVTGLSKKVPGVLAVLVEDADISDAYFLASSITEVA
jgi:hypothetical protein